MNRVQKAEHLEYLKKVVEEAQSLIFIDYQGLTVEEVNRVRREFEAQECEYKVVKNTVFMKATEGTSVQGIESFMFGPVAIAFSRQDPVAPAKLAVKFAKEFDKFEIKGGHMEGQVLDAAGVDQLSKMPSKDEMRARLLATMLAAPQKFLRLLQAAPQKFLLALDARKRQLEGE